MKKTAKIFGFIAVAAMTIVGCAKEIDAPKEESLEKGVKTHTVTITTGSPQTKTVINEGLSSASFKWSSDDATRFHVFENEVEGTSIGLETSDEYVTVKLTATFATVSAASYTYNAFLAKNVYNDEYPQVPSAQTCTGSSYDPNSDVLIAKPVTNEGAVLDKLNMQFGRPCVINKMTLKGLTEGETVSSVEIYADKPLTGYYDIAGKEWTGESAKITLTTSQVVPASGQVTVYFVTMPVESATLTVTAITDAHVYNKTFGSTINFVMDQVTKFGVSSLGKFKYRDVITQSLTGLDTSGGSLTYDDWSGKSYAGSRHSSAVYAGNTCKYVDYLQIRGKTNSGIITTTSGGSLKRVFVAYASGQNPQNGRVMAVLGKNTAYAATSELYNDSTKGEEAGSFTYATGDKVAFVNASSEYDYVALLPDGAIYFDEVDIFWDDAKSDPGIKWTADGNSGDAVAAASGVLKTGLDDMPAAALYNPNSVSVVYSSTDDTVAEINSTSGVITLKAAGSTTIKATFEGNSTYKAKVVSYTLTVTDGRSICAAPTFSPAAGEVDENTTVRISSNTANATIYYKVGSEPTTSSYDGISTLTDGSDKPYIEVTIDVAKTLYAFAVKDDWKDSPVSSAAYTVSGVTVPLTAPTDVTITAMSTSGFNASWTASANASGYSWVLSTADDPNNIAAGNTKASGTIASGSTVTLSKTGLTGDNVLVGKTPYYFYIKATGTGSWSDSGYAYDVKGFLVVDGTQLPTTKFANETKSYDYHTDFEVSFTAAAAGTGRFSLGGGATNYLENTSAIIIGKKDASMHNTTAVPGPVSKFELYQNKGGSSSVSVGINFSSSAIASYNSSASNTFKQTLAADTAYDCSSSLASNTKYFWFQVTNNNNAQVQIRILYTPED